MNSPLAFLNVLSLAEQYPGPLCTQLLADLGAHVTLIERPDGGDPQRDHNPWLFRTTGMNKRSVALNLKRSSDYKVAISLVSQADVIVDGFRPGVLKRLGLGFERLRKVNRRIVYCSITGYGQVGPYSSFTGHNINYEAVSGLLAPYLRGDVSDESVGNGLPIGDIVSAMVAAMEILAQFVSQPSSPREARHIDVSITDALLMASAPRLVRAINGVGTTGHREAGYGVYECEDGRVALGIAFEDVFWDRMCERLHLPHLSGIPHAERVSRRVDLKVQLSRQFASMTVGEVLRLLGTAGVPVSPVNALEDVRNDPQVEHRCRFTSALDEAGRDFVTVLSPLAPREPASKPKVPALGSANDVVIGGDGDPRL